MTLVSGDMDLVRYGYLDLIYNGQCSGGGKAITPPFPIVFV